MTTQPRTLRAQLLAVLRYFERQRSGSYPYGLVADIKNSLRADRVREREQVKQRKEK